MDGIIVINKPKGITSFDVVRSLRKILKIKKIGHTGTLDPMATGLMLICVGKATKLASDLEAEEKVYEAGIEFGYATDTYDVEGQVTERKEKKVFREEVEKVIPKFLGEIKQVPPMYSALKVNGQKLYDLARQGITVERKARDINIEYIKFLDYEDNKGKFLTKVSKGTYIRSLIYDLGKELDTYATMTSLMRCEVGAYNLDMAYTLEEIENLTQENNFSFLKSVEDMFDFEKFSLTEVKQETLFKNGNTVKLLDKKISNGKYRIYFQNKFLGLAEAKNNLIKGYKYF
ncbi:MAG: tRNA pseudouridine(55) synthase TruB [Fusobacteriales bacterium]|nr:MAG: tRNA pseudouridine(55) synthase TruB [Fusobacteriales bacterium]